MRRFIGSLLCCIGLLVLMVDMLIWAFQYSFELGILIVCLILMLAGRLMFDYEEDI